MVTARSARSIASRCNSAISSIQLHDNCLRCPKFYNYHNRWKRITIALQAGQLLFDPCVDSRRTASANPRDLQPRLTLEQWLTFRTDPVVEAILPCGTLNTNHLFRIIKYKEGYRVGTMFSCIVTIRPGTQHL